MSPCCRETAQWRCRRVVVRRWRCRRVIVRRAIGECCRQIAEMKKRLEGDAGQMESFEESRKKMQRDAESAQLRIEGLSADNDKMNKSKKKLQSEVGPFDESNEIIRYVVVGRLKRLDGHRWTVAVGRLRVWQSRLGD